MVKEKYMSKLTTTTFDGVLIDQKLLDFYNAIKLKNPMLIGKPSDWRKQTIFDNDGTSTKVMSVLEIRHSDKPDSVMGKISYWDDKYYVHSRLIKNEKFAYWNKNEYHAKSSMHMKNMIKVALANLIPLTIQEIAEASDNKTDISSDVQEISTSIKTEIKYKIDYIDRAVWFEELLHMHDTGYTPKSDKLADLVKFALDNKEKYEQDYKYKPNKMFVHIYEDESVCIMDKDGRVNGYAKLDMLPEDILSKVMVLMVTPEQTFVRDIGKKDTSNKLWVLV
jgi:hypothetical protein